MLLTKKSFSLLNDSDGALSTHVGLGKGGQANSE